MTIEPSDFPNGHGQNGHFGQDRNTILLSNLVMVKWSKLTDISTISTNCNNSTTKKSGIVEIVLIKFGLTMKIL
jgi:hypothetical protein